MGTAQPEFDSPPAQQAICIWVACVQHYLTGCGRAKRADSLFYASRIPIAEDSSLESLDSLIRGLRWLGLEWDEGPDIGGPFAPYVQSQRQEIYLKKALELIDRGHAYRCFCTPERLASLRDEQRRAGHRTGYDRHCRRLTDEERSQREAEEIPSVIRFAVPLEGVTTFKDLVRGDIRVENKQMQDEVLLKADGLPNLSLGCNGR